MRESLPLLLHLQKMDAEIREIEAQRTDLPKRLADSKAALEAKRAALAARQEELKKARVAADTRERDLKEQEGRIQKLDQQLNTVKTNKEYSVLKSEIAAIKADCGLIEDDILQLMSKVEAVTVDLRAAEAELKAAEAQLAPLEKEVSLALAELDTRISQRRQARDGTAQNISQEVMGIYNRARAHNKNRDGSGLAKVVEGEEKNWICAGCFMELNTQDVNLVFGRRQIVTCRSCARILFAER